MSSNASNKAEAIKVKLKINGAERAPNRIQIELNIGAYPYVSVTHHTNKDATQKAVVPTEQSITRFMGGVQQRMFAERTTEDFDLSVKTDASGEFSFKGYVSNPQYSFNAYNVGETDQALPTYSLMDCMDFSIYCPSVNTQALNTSWDNVSSLDEFIKTHAKKLMDSWFNLKTIYGDGTLSAELVQKQHEKNQKFFNYFTDILTASKDTIGWEKVIDYFKKLRAGAPMSSRVSGILSAHTGSFLNTINALSEEFQCLYVPEVDNPGKLCNRNKLFESPEELKLDIVGMSLTAGNAFGLFPISYAAVQPPMQIQNSQLLTTGIKNYVTYPEDMGGDSQITNSGPPWMPAVYIPIKVPKTGETPVKPSSGVNVNRVKSTDVKNKLLEQSNYGRKILTEWAKSVYRWESLCASGATLTLPLNFKDGELGKRYTVQDKDGNKLFSGFLTGIAHYIMSGDPGHCSTEFRFSHVECGDFKLPKSK